jgi:hypothetical protein
MAWWWGGPVLSSFLYSILLDEGRGWEFQSFGGGALAGGSQVEKRISPQRGLQVREPLRSK